MVLSNNDIFTESYLLKNDEWKHDIIPELHEGKNFADFIDPDIAARLEELEAEEERLAEQGFYDSGDDDLEASDAEDDEAIRKTAALIRKRRASIKQDSQQKKMGKQNRVPLPRTRPAVHRTQSDVTNALKRAGYDTSSLEQRAALTAQARKAIKAEKRKRAEEDDVEMGDATFDTAADTSMDVDMDDSSVGPSKRTKGNTGIAARRPGKPNRNLAGLRDEAQLEEADKKLSMARKERNRLGKAGDADRHSASNSLDLSLQTADSDLSPDSSRQEEQASAVWQARIGYSEPPLRAEKREDGTCFWWMDLLFVSCISAFWLHLI